MRRYQRLYRELFDKELPDLPESTRDALIDRHVSLDWLAVGLRESRDLDALYSEMRTIDPLPDVPVIVVASTGRDGFQDAVSSGEAAELLEAEIEGKLRLYRERLASGPDADVRTVDTGHVTLAFREPEAIIRAVNDVLG